MSISEEVPWAPPTKSTADITVRRAAIFDLDRTLIAGSSAQVFGQMLNDVGIEVPAPPGRSVYFGLYARFGEDPITMRLARHAARLFAGERVRSVEAAGRMAADVLASTVLDAASRELQRHRSDHTKLLLATTAPHELAAPFCEALGFDDLVCTRYASVNGRYDGTNETPYLWGAAKAAAVLGWAADKQVDLTQSSAYSDSWYDVPLLEIVGQPVAVNPDLRLRLTARSRRWPTRQWQHD
jgi:putative phosphoserine phosphatase/1-acylglycerol-3-phosphate O-acyltransferase